ncbi:MAG: amino acid adenylation domain-containing protein [Rhodospirillales bacterium]|nr:amino acid adenylation domain-containing protein [Rhodospirillales bacterium]
MTYQTTFLIQDLISDNAGKRPKSLAIQEGDLQVSYKTFDEASNQLANSLYDVGVRRGSRIPLLVGKKTDILASMISVLKADGIYVPLDIKAPVDRLVSIIDQLETPFLICDVELAVLANNIAAELVDHLEVLVIPSLTIDGWHKTIQWGPSEPPPRAKNLDMLLSRASKSKRDYTSISEDVAYIVFTSGSTGAPKGVMIPHRAVLDYARWTTDHFQITPRDRLSSHAECHFDLSVFDIYTAFYAGASLYPVPKSTSMFPAKFYQFVEEYNISIWCSVPSLYTYFCKLGKLKSERMSSLRAMTFCGEVMPTSTIIDWMTAYPKIRFVNQYGPSETTCASMYYDFDTVPTNPSESVPIGRAIPNTEIFVLNGEGKQASENEIGELCIRGAGNGLGYWRKPDETERSFVQNPLCSEHFERVYRTGDLARLRPDGEYEYCGRRDQQVKYMGYRIELGDIEAAMSAQPGVSVCAVVVVKGESENDIRLIAGYEGGSQDNNISPDTLRKILGEQLPNYMVPKKCFRLENIPLNRNGKVDRHQLLEIIEGQLKEKDSLG